jgi:hypothetical protein
MIRFKKMLKETKQHEICFCENENVTLYWPIIDGWTQNGELCVCKNEDNISISYFNDDKNFIVWFEIVPEENIFSEQKCTYKYMFWGMEKNEKFKSIKSIKSILKKVEKEYDIAKKDALKKIPTFDNWKRVITDVEISFSRKQNDRTVIVKINNVNNFIKYYNCVGANICIYDDFSDNRIIEKEFYGNGSRNNIKKLISELDDKYFKDI